MIQIIMKFLSMFCGLGGQYILPFIMPLINPLSWSTLLLCIFLPIYYSKNNFMNYDKDKNTKNSTKAFGYSFLIHYLICVIFLFFAYGAICKVSNTINPF